MEIAVVVGPASATSGFLVGEWFQRSAFSAFSAARRSGWRFRWPTWSAVRRNSMTLKRFRWAEGVRTDPRSGRRHRRRSHRRPTSDDAIRVLAIDGTLRPAAGVAWGEYLNKVPRAAALFLLGSEPAGFLGAETASAATLSVVGSRGGVAVPGRRRCAGQARPRAVGIYRVTPPGGAGVMPLMTSMICWSACSMTRSSKPPNSVNNAVSAASGAPNA
jgi:hypothetical protein